MVTGNGPKWQCTWPGSAASTHLSQSLCLPGLHVRAAESLGPNLPIDSENLAPFPITTRGSIFALPGAVPTSDRHGRRGSTTDRGVSHAQSIDGRGPGLYRRTWFGTWARCATEGMPTPRIVPATADNSIPTVGETTVTEIPTDAMPAGTEIMTADTTTAGPGCTGPGAMAARTECGWISGVPALVLQERRLPAADHRREAPSPRASWARAARACSSAMR